MSCTGRSQANSVARSISLRSRSSAIRCRVPAAAVPHRQAAASIQARLGRWAFRRRWASITGDSRRSTLSRLSSARLCAGRSRLRLVMVLKPSIPRLESHGRKRARPGGRSVTKDEAATNRWGDAPHKQRAGPAVKTKRLRLTPRGAQCAVGGTRAQGQDSGRRANSIPTLLLSEGLMPARLLSDERRCVARSRIQFASRMRWPGEAERTHRAEPAPHPHRLDDELVDGVLDRALRGIVLPEVHHAAPQRLLALHERVPHQGRANGAA